MESLVQISSQNVQNILGAIDGITHTIVPEKFRVCDDNKPGVLEHPVGICGGPLGNMFISDIRRGTVFKIRTSHYPAEVQAIITKLDTPLGLEYFNGILYVAECGKNQIIYKDLEGCQILDPVKMTVIKMKNKLKELDLWQNAYNSYKKEDLKRVLESYLGSKGKKDLSQERQSHHVLKILGQFKMSKPASLCSCTLSGKDTLIIGSMAGDILWCELQCDGITVTGQVLQTMNIAVMEIVALVVTEESLYVGSHAQDGGILKLTYDTPSGKWNDTFDVLLSNKSDKCQRVYGLAFSSENTLLFIDLESVRVCELDIATGNITNIANNGPGQRDGSKGQFCQPSGIAIQGNTLFIVDTAVGKFKTIVRPRGLIQYLKNLHDFCKVFGIHEKGCEAAEYAVEDAIAALVQVYEFDKNCVDKVKTKLGIPQSGSTQGPQGTVSSATLQDQAGILSGIRGLKNSVLQINPEYMSCIKISSLTTLVVENLFAEVRGAIEMPLMAQFCHHFERTVRERLKRQSACPFVYYTGEYSYYQKVTNKVKTTTLPRMPQPDSCVLTNEQLDRMRQWRAEYGQSVPQKTVRNMTTKDNPGTLPINLYERPQASVKPLDFTRMQLRDATSQNKEAPHLSTPVEHIYHVGEVVGVQSDGKISLGLIQKPFTIRDTELHVKHYLQDVFEPSEFILLTSESVPISKDKCLGSIQSFEHLGTDVISVSEEEIVLLQAAHINEGKCKFASVSCFII